MTLDSVLQRRVPAIVAILRGVRPEEVVEIAEALLDAGVGIVEVPLNSPQPLLSIERLAAHAGERALIGAGTVLTAAAVDEVASAGGRLIVSPNTEPAVIARALECGLEPVPGAMTPTEAFAALAAGARHIKLFPAASLGPAHVRALCEVLPAECRLWSVGGASAANLGQWIAAGAVGVGIGGSLYQPGDSAATVQARARALVSAWRAVQTQSPSR